MARLMPEHLGSTADDGERFSLGAGEPPVTGKDDSGMGYP